MNYQPFMHVALIWSQTTEIFIMYSNAALSNKIITYRKSRLLFKVKNGNDPWSLDFTLLRRFVRNLKTRILKKVSLVKCGVSIVYCLLGHVFSILISETRGPGTNLWFKLCNLTTATKTMIERLQVRCRLSKNIKYMNKLCLQ